MLSFFGYSQNLFHDTKGKVDVDGGGNLQFTLPIEIPPGVKNVAPQININYTSASGNGLVGFGWNISGLSSISRIGKTIEKDNELIGVKINYSDYYNFNGQRLILKSGEYGKDGAEYITEKYSNIKIKSFGTSIGVEGPALFHLTFEDGSQAWYGGLQSGNTQSATASRTVLEYNITKWMDNQGNYISYEYEKNNPVDNETALNGGVTKIKKIKWGGNEVMNKPHFNEIVFNYNIDRTFKELSYHEGYYFNQDKLLNEIIVNTNQSQFKRYLFEYTQNTTSYQFANKITEFNSNNEPANPVLLHYKNDQTGSEEYSKENDVATTNTKKYADFDMDGITDYLEFIPTPGSSPSGPVGVINFKNSIYESTTIHPLQYDLSKFTLNDFKNAVPITIKKDNYVKNSIGIVIPVPKSTNINYKKDYELQIYTIDLENNKLNFEYSKTIDYDSYSPLSLDDDLDFCNTPSAPSLLEAVSYDYNGDNISELILKFRVNRLCGSPTGPTGPIIIGQNQQTSNSIDSLPMLEPSLNSSNTEFGNDENIEEEPVNIAPGQYYKMNSNYVFVDLDQNVSVPHSVYKFSSSTGGGNPLKFADFNGDGIAEIIIQPASQFTEVLNVKRDDNFNYSQLSIGNFNPDFAGTQYKGLLLGDFNGDSKADILVPQADKSYNWDLYMSDGKQFQKKYINNFIFYSSGTEVLMESSHNVFEQGGGCSFNESRYFQYNVADLDGDGKSEIVVSYVFMRNHEWSQHGDEEHTVLRTAVFSVNKATNDTSANKAWQFVTYGGGDYNVTYQNSPIQTNSNVNFYRIREWRKEYPHKIIPFGTLNLNRNSQQIVSIGRPDNCSGAVGCTYNFVQHYNYTHVPEISKIKTIIQGGQTTSIDYKQINNIANSDFYKPRQKEQYPFFEMEKAPYYSVVSRIQQDDRRQDFLYRGLVSHLTGKGMIGFRQIARSSWYADNFENTVVWNGIETDPLKDGLPVKEWSIKTNIQSNVIPTNISENNTQLLNFKSTTYQTDLLLNGQITTVVSNADKPNIVTANLPKNTLSKNFMTGVKTMGIITYGDFYLASENKITINDGYAETTTNFNYIHNINGNGVDYFIGRPEFKTEIVTAYGDTKSAKEDYLYENNLLKTLKKWNRDNSGYILETYNYDGFGNIIGKTISNSIDAQTETIQQEYDSKGRFVIKKTDNLGLETNIEYNNWGLILNETDPIGNTLGNNYNSWGKLLTSSSNITGTTTYGYVKDNNYNTIITQNSPDGNVNITYLNKLGQNYKTSTKALEQGQYISNEVQYDILGRKKRESEPYFEGQNYILWNLTTYDDTYYPPKVNSISFNGKQSETSVTGLITKVKELNGYQRINSQVKDAIGNVMTSTDAGGSVVFQYNAAGEQITANYQNNIVTTKYDEWGRKSEVNDPSNGLYKYEYYGLGKPKKIISPKGEKFFEYNSLGQLFNQTETSTDGTSTYKTITIAYDQFGRIISRSGISNGKTYSSSVEYDQYGRLKSTTEISNGKQYVEKDFVYDNISRILTHKKSLISSATTTEVIIKNVYNSWSGELYQLKDNNSGMILWELQNVSAKGQVLSAKLGASTVTNLYDSNGFLTNTNHSSVIKPSILQVGYSFDAIKNELNSRNTGGDFNISESFVYDNNNRLINWTNPRTGLNSNNTYDAKGRITYNDQLGNVKYENPGKIYQPSSMVLNSNGIQNYTNDLLQKITYNENNDPLFLDGLKGDVAFEYGLTSMRQKVTYGGNFTSDSEGNFTKFYSEDGSFEVLRNNEAGEEKHILYIGGTPYESNIIFLKNFSETNGSYKFLHKDYIGNILAISDETGNKLEQRHFDAWGNFTHLQIGNGGITSDKNIIDNASLLLERGYTSHEHFTEVGIIHMNGRLYDPLLRRFLNADENIQDPYNTQNYNKYGYVLNNPLMFNDPTGEFLGIPELVSAVIIAVIVVGYSYTVGVSISGANWDLGQFAKSTVISAGTSVVTFGVGPVFSGAGLWASIGNGAVTGAISGGINSIASGTNFFKGVLTGAVLGGALGAVSYTINYYANGYNKSDYITTDDVAIDDTQPLENDLQKMIQNIKDARKDIPDFARMRIDSETVGLSNSKGNLISVKGPSEGGIALARTDPSFVSGKSYIVYSQRAASDVRILRQVMSHESMHALNRALGIPNYSRFTKLDEVKTSGDLALSHTNHIAMRKLEHLYARNNWIIPGSTYVDIQYIDQIIKGLTGSQIISYNYLYGLYYKYFNITYKFP